MFFNRLSPRNLKHLFSSHSSIFTLISKTPPAYTFTQNRNYVDVYMKWKKDSYYDSIDSIHKSIQLKPLIALKNCITAAPDGFIPISAVSKRDKELGVPFKIARFLRQYPSVFEEFTGPQYNLPWFRLTPEAVELDREECEVYRDCRGEIVERLKKLVLMSGEKRLPLKIIQGMQWYLGLPDEFLRNPEANFDGCFRIVEMEDGLKGLAVESEERVLSVMERNVMKRGEYGGEAMEGIAFPLFPSKGLRLKHKILNWLDQFQRLPYVSPYEGLLGKKLLCLRKYLGLPQKVHKAFERHPYMFYLSLRNKTCTAILKEAYCDKSAIEAHPLSAVRKKYINLMKQSEVILKNRRVNNSVVDHRNVLPKLDLDYVEEDVSLMAEDNMDKDKEQRFVQRRSLNRGQSRAPRSRSWLTMPEAAENCRYAWMSDALLLGFTKLYHKNTTATGEDFPDQDCCGS
ncbi:ubiquitin carboxyl-terminal hydrolase family protein [Actinidia rufa]|uniref:Ubiquitin carboxyl-terminal hydrolase family protein n=1 Tax=Actinidia rufa TaxID=165716 RepID=A0A7J0EVS6_9ERIC|nr:ubiquitin carboxyl-terminal hydrolase family protein [Actinidia rufa]